jgi:hypothetical protein
LYAIIVNDILGSPHQSGIINRTVEDYFVSLVVYSTLHP